MFTEEIADNYRKDFVSYAVESGVILFASGNRRPSPMAKSKGGRIPEMSLSQRILDA
jgi:hypothetical protein